MTPRGLQPARDPDDVVTAVREAVGADIEAPAARFCVAVSGGLDSSVLLHVLASLVPGRLRAVYVNHQLHPDAARWGEDCAALCRNAGVPFVSLEVMVSAGGEGPEAAARHARYRALGRELAPGELLLTAHHRDDQAETVIMNLCRGSGAAGLAGIPRRAPFAAGELCRPLLDLPRSALLGYALRAGLRWVDDPANTDPRMDRNFVRHRVIPALESRWPGARGAIGRSARLTAEAAGLLDELAAHDARRVQRRGRVLMCALQDLSEPRQRNVLRHLCRRQLGAPPPEARLREGLAQMHRAPADRLPLVSWSRGEIRRYQGALYLMAPLAAWRPPAAAVQVPVRAGAEADLGGAAGRITLLRSHGRGLALARLGPSLHVRFRAGGERLRLVAGGPSRDLKKLFQERHVVPWMRPRIPLLYCGDALVAVAGLWVAVEFAAGGDEPGVRVRWDRHLPIE